MNHKLAVHHEDADVFIDIRLKIAYIPLGSASNTAKRRGRLGVPNDPRMSASTSAFEPLNRQ